MEYSKMPLSIKAKQKMNIVYIVEDYSENGGVERIVSMKANLMATQLHHQVTLISLYEDKRPCQYSLEDDISLKLLHVPFACKSKNPLLRLYSRVKTLLLAAHRLNKVIEQIQPDVIFFTTIMGALLLPVCHTSAKKIFESHSARLFTPFHRLFYWTEKKADMIICLTEEDAHEYKHAKEVRVIPNFINLPQVKVENYSCKKAIAVGRLESVKGFDRLIKCWKVIAERYPEWHLDIYGDGTQRKDLLNLIEDLHLTHQVRLCGRHENMQEMYPHYSLHVMSSHYEGQGIAMVEAQACGLPSVSFNFKYGAKDIIKNQYNGILVEQDDEKAFIQAIEFLITHQNLRKEYGEKAISESKRYAKEAIFCQWKSLLDACNK